MSIMTDLWPEKIKNGTINAPVSVLREQAEFLGAKTDNLITAEVEISDISSDSFTYHFYIVAPTLNNYHYRLFTISHDIHLYPVIIVLGDELGSELGASIDQDIFQKMVEQQSRGLVALGLMEQPQAKYTLVAQSESEFISHLKDILRSNKAIQVITALQSQLRSNRIPY